MSCPEGLQAADFGQPTVPWAPDDMVVCLVPPGSPGRILRRMRLTRGKKKSNFYPILTASSLFRPRRFAPANGGVFSSLAAPPIVLVILDCPGCPFAPG